MATSQSERFTDFTEKQMKGPIKQIMDRAERLGLTTDRLALHMDLAAVDFRTSLDIEQPAAFPDLDFIHDIRGIQENFDRETMMMQNCFSPRCTLLQSETCSVCGGHKYSLAAQAARSENNQPFFTPCRCDD